MLPYMKIWAQCNHKDACKGDGEGGRRVRDKGDVMMEARVGVSEGVSERFEEGGRSLQPGIQVVFSTWKRQGRHAVATPFLLPHLPPPGELPLSSLS